MLNRFSASFFSEIPLLQGFQAHLQESVFLIPNREKSHWFSQENCPLLQQLFISRWGCWELICILVQLILTPSLFFLLDICFSIASVLILYDQIFACINCLTAFFGTQRYIVRSVYKILSALLLLEHFPFVISTCCAVQ